MRSQIQSASRPPSPWNIPVLNTSGDTIPPHGVMEIVNASEVGEDTIYHVAKPGISGTRVFVINSPAEIEQEGAGWATETYPTDVAFNAFSGTPGPGTQWDVVVGSFLLAIPIPGVVISTGVKYNILGGARIAVGEPSLVRAAPAPAVGNTQDTDRLVAAHPGDPLAKTLIEKISTAVPPDGFGEDFVAADHQLVFADIPPGENKVRLYTDKVTAAPAALNTYICTLFSSGGISGGSTGGRGSGSGTVYALGPGGGNSSIGTRTIFNPFLSVAPGIGGGGQIIYVCAKTFQHPTNATADEYTITGVDPFYVMAARGGFGEKKALAVPEGGSTPELIQWLGEECEESSG
jgi:hypothetical protein